MIYLREYFNRFKSDQWKISSKEEYDSVESLESLEIKENVLVKSPLPGFSIPENYEWKDKNYNIFIKEENIIGYRKVISWKNRFDGIDDHFDAYVIINIDEWIIYLESYESSSIKKVIRNYMIDKLIN